jgi:hypothetical protein
MMPGEPVEPHVRSEVPPDDAIVIVRGGPIAAEKIVEHALRQAREYSYEGRPMFSVSVSLTVDGWDLAGLADSKRSTLTLPRVERISHILRNVERSLFSASFK